MSSGENIIKIIELFRVIIIIEVMEKGRRRLIASVHKIILLWLFVLLLIVLQGAEATTH